MLKVVVSIAALAAVASSQAVVWGFSAPIMSGNQEVPPNSSTAYGTASLTIDDQSWAVGGSVNIWGLSPTQIIGMHIHQAPAGANGPVRFDILANQVGGSPINAGTFWVYIFNGTLNLGSTANNQAFLNAMINDQSYINAHTPQFPGGEIRGQIECNGVVPEPATMAALGLGVLPFLRRLRKK
jgi:hypothetical protein